MYGKHVGYQVTPSFVSEIFKSFISGITKHLLKVVFWVRGLEIELLASAYQAGA